MTRWLPCAFLALVWLSCDSGGVVPRDAGPVDTVSPDIGPAVDSGIPGDAEEPGAFEVVADDVAIPEDVPPLDVGPEVTIQARPYFPARSFRLEPAGRQGDALLVHVVARDFDALFGVALRVEWDPEVLVLRDTALDPVFGEAGTAAIYKVAEVRPGSLALAWAGLGSKTEVPLTGDVRLATLTFGVVKAASSSITFYVPRCLALTRRLDKVESAYLSAVVTP